MEKKSQVLFALFAAAALCASAGAADRTDRNGRSEDTFQNTRPVANRAEYSPSVGLMAGFSNTNDDAVSNGASYLLDVGFQPIVPISVGAQFQRVPATVDGTNLDFNTNNYLLRAAYNLGGDIPVLQYSYLGAKAGLTQYTGDVESSTHFSFGPMVGVDVPVDRTGHFTLGGELAYLAVLGDFSPDQASLLGAAKYWF